MIVLLPVAFSVLLTIGLMVAIIIGSWFYRSNYFIAASITAMLLGIAGVILCVESITFAADLQHYVSANEVLAGRVLALSATIPAIVACLGSLTLLSNTVYRYWANRQKLATRPREVAEV